MVGPDPSYAPSRSTSDKKNKIDPPIRTEYCLSGGATTLIFIVGGGNSVVFVVIRSPISWNMVVPPGNMTGTYEFTRMSNVTLHDGVEKSVVDSAGFNANEIRWKKTLVQRKRSALTVNMFPSESMWVCFLSELSAVDLSSVS